MHRPLSRRLKGWRTVIVSAAWGVLPLALEFAGLVDWRALGFSPAGAMLLSAGITVALRVATTTPIGRGE